MGSHYYSSFPLALIILLFTCYCLSAAAADWSPSSFSSSSSSPPPGQDRYTAYVEKKCKNTTDPSLCSQTLSPFAEKINRSPRRIALFAMTAVHGQAWSTAEAIVQALKNESKGGGGAALSACSEAMSDFHDGLGPSMTLLGDARSGNHTLFLWHISVIEKTLGTEVAHRDTCLNKQLRGDLTAKIGDGVGRVSELTHIALALVDNFSKEVQKKWKAKEHNPYYYYNNFP